MSIKLVNSFESSPGSIASSIEIVIVLFLIKLPFFGHTVPEFIAIG